MHRRAQPSPVGLDVPGGTVATMPATDTAEPTMVEDRSGTRWWKLDDTTLHRDSGPAVEMLDGTCQWYRHGLQHRDGGPAYHRPGGHDEWWVDGELHRADGPALTSPGGMEQWWWRGLRIRAGDVATWRTVEVAARDLVADLYRCGVRMTDAVAAARRLNRPATAIGMTGPDDTVDPITRSTRGAA